MENLLRNRLPKIKLLHATIVLYQVIENSIAAFKHIKQHGLNRAKIKFTSATSKTSAR